jgi:hypothetical protein
MAQGLIMAEKKKKSKASLEEENFYKKINDSSGELPKPYLKTFEIVYKDSDDLLGTIKLIDEDLSTNEKLEKHSKKAPVDFRPECYLDLIDKFKNAKDKKKLRFSDFEIRVLEKALDKGYSFCEIELNYNHLRAQLAWANTVFKDSSSRTDDKLRDVGRILGFTHSSQTSTITPSFNIPLAASGKQPKYDPEIIIPRYEELIKSGTNEREAVKQCSSEFLFASPDACSRYLRKHGLQNIPGFR